jgi:hypothetical protein
MTAASGTTDCLLDLLKTSPKALAASDNSFFSEPRISLGNSFSLTPPVRIAWKIEAKMMNDIARGTGRSPKGPITRTEDGGSTM